MQPDSGLLASPPQSLAARLADRLQERALSNQLRARRAVHISDSTHLEVAGRRCVNFASNNYLGLTHHPKLIAVGASIDGGVGSGAAGLVTGYSQVHAAAEAKIAAWKGTESAVLLPSGYQANLAAIQTLAALAAADGGVRFLVDKLVHASLIDAVRATGFPFRIFPHNHLAKLERLLGESADGELQVVVTESIFSMDGDAADIGGIALLKERFGFALMVDEAHACGVYGDGGAGLLAEMGHSQLSDLNNPKTCPTKVGTPLGARVGWAVLHRSQLADVIVCTFSKAAGAIGGAICGSKLFCDGVVNFGRAYIYSTAVPPWVARLAGAAIDVMKEEPWRQKRVRSLAEHVREKLRAAGVDVPAGDSPIVPVILGDEQRTAEAAERLLSAGFFVTAIRPPTVPRGTSRLRVTLSCDHTDGEIEMLVSQLRHILPPI